MFVRVVDGVYMYVLVHINDIIIIDNNDDQIDTVVHHLNNEFSHKAMRILNYF